ncbi:porin [Chitinophaga sp. LS1]|uniref:porin n=1 Tax=Chitinophaga sp. LS1 TaxID=3051176 RepID=UPI002AAB516E|nr:porin [Chitinophaga sp. LS1]WPV69137.1 porin [Chitinophaga sp. LS1]
MRLKLLPIVGVFLLLSSLAKAQFLMDMIDTTKNLGKGMFSLYQKYDAMRFSGYIQPQFQLAQGKGIETYAGGNFPDHVNNRFMLRRGRFRLDYQRYNANQMPVVQFAFQFDGTERGVFIRDFFGRLFENRWDVFSVTTGMFARPFGYEVNLASSDRETPERGRMSQILMKTERDLGAMVTFEPRRQDNPFRFMRIDAGLFNGQGLNASSDFDSHKDLIARVSVKPQRLNAANWLLSGSISCLYGGYEQFTNYIYKVGGDVFKVDSSAANVGKIAPRHYYGADVQLKIPNGKKGGFTELRAEYIRGVQTATLSSSESLYAIPMNGTVNAPLYVRNFDGAYFYFLQNLGSPKDLIVLKYDWYDPNRDVNGTQIGATGAGFTKADIKYNTFGAGYVHYFDANTKLMFYYDWVKNETTALTGYTEDVKDNVFTCRIQYRF